MGNADANEKCRVTGTPQAHGTDRTHDNFYRSHSLHQSQGWQKPNYRRGTFVLAFGSATAKVSQNRLLRRLLPFRRLQSPLGGPFGLAG